MSTNELAVVAIDLGGTNMKGALVAADGQPIVTLTRETPASDVLGALLDMADQLKRAGEEEGRTVVAGGVVTPGIIDEQNGIVRYASNLGWKDVPLRAELASRLGIPIVIGHDVRGAAHAELLVGAGRGMRDVALIQIGTGVAAALITADRTITGAAGAAGEFGHIPVYPGGELCTCGQRGCLEVYVSGAGLARRYAAHGGGPLSSREIASRVSSDPIAATVWRHAVEALAHGIVTVTLLLDPAAVILGGGFARAGSTLLDPLEVAVAAGLKWRESPSILVSPVGAEASRIGAAILAFRHVGRDDIVEPWTLAAEQVRL